MEEEEKLESKKRDYKVEITEVAISKVPYIEYKGIDEEHYPMIQSLAKKVLRLAKEKNDGNETAIAYGLDSFDLFAEKMDDDDYCVSFGDEHSVYPFQNTDSYHLLRSSRPCVIVVVHNHPSLSKVSLQDVGLLLNFDTVKMIVVVTNLGAINYIIKTEKYSRREALPLYYEALDMERAAKNLKEMQKAADFFLNNCYKCGLLFEDR